MRRDIFFDSCGTDDLGIAHRDKYGAVRMFYKISGYLHLPEYLDDFVDEDNAVRVVDAFINKLDMVALGFEGANPASTGRPCSRAGRDCA